MYNQRPSLFGNLFPQRRDNTKKVVILSALTGIVSAAATNFFSKKENRDKTKQHLARMAEEARVIKDRIYDKVESSYEEISDTVKSKAKDISDHIPEIQIKHKADHKNDQKTTVTVDVDAGK
jgi:gas vesicle protein